MPTVALRFSPLAEHVRTARLVAVAVARRAGFEESQLDEIRIAIGEACARAVLRTTHEAFVTMDLIDDDDRLDVVVRDATAGSSGDDEDPLALALMEGMAEDVHVDDSDATAGAVRMSWSRQPAPTGDARPAGP